MTPVHQKFLESTSNSATEKHKEIEFLIRLPLAYSEPGLLVDIDTDIEKDN